MTVGVGFGIDYALYIVSRAVEEYKGDVTEAVRLGVATAGTKVQEPKKLTAIHRARSNPISEQKRMLENAHSVVDMTKVTAVKVAISDTGRRFFRSLAPKR